MGQTILFMINSDPGRTDNESKRKYTVNSYFNRVDKKKLHMDPNGVFIAKDMLRIHGCVICDH